MVVTTKIKVTLDHKLFLQFRNKTFGNPFFYCKGSSPWELWLVDGELWKEFNDFSMEEGEHGLGVVLVTAKSNCRMCRNCLRLNICRISDVIVYHETKGTCLGSKIPKVCCVKKCSFTQHYGYYTIGDKKYYDEDWVDNEYLLCSTRTAFDLTFLKKYEIEILLSKMSFKEKAEIYNAFHDNRSVETIQSRICEEKDLKKKKRRREQN